MGQLHNEIRSGPLTDAVMRALGVTRQGGVERFSETLTPTMNPWDEGEWNYLRQETLYAKVQFATAVAGETSAVAITNPTASNLILVVKRCTTRGSAANTVLLGTATRTVIAATLTLGNPALVRDSRWANKLVPADSQIVTPIEMWSGSDPLSISSTFEEMGPLASYSEAISMPVVLRPGTGLFAQGTVVNVGVGATFVGHYRRAFPGELT